MGKIDGQIYAVGNPAFDKWIEAITKKRRSYKIGLAYNTLDHLDDVDYLIRTLEKKIEGYEICLRPHPADGRVIHFYGKFTISNSKTQSSNSFLKEIDIVIAGNTSLLLEAACMNVLPLQYDFSNYDSYLQDYYGFIRNGLTIHCKSIEEIIDNIKGFDNMKSENIRSRAKGYDASIASDYEFQVKEKIFSILDKQLI
ncbi:hypothetical protein [Lunatimonas salinarum]|uniref:hypothetical protein n=1 Tax=Lunatimonas salinarum TaxID=1774590 RepID=UPI001AE04ED3|nr:hypothetical protein [Lunatimonas salinarum]